MPDIHDTLRKARSYIAKDRELLIESVTLSDGSIPEPCDGEAVMEIEALLNEIDEALQ